ncbi:MAG: gamma-glutamyl-phosphate reductase, partial [Sphingomonas hengshuiensis]
MATMMMPDDEIAAMAARARTAAGLLSQMPSSTRAAGLRAAATALRAAKAAIVTANAEDMDRAAARGLSGAML